MNCLLVMKINWSLDINTGAVERSEAARARSLAGATVGVPYADLSVFYKKCTKTRTGLRLYTLTIGQLVRSGPRFIAYPNLRAGNAKLLDGWNFTGIRKDGPYSPARSAVKSLAESISIGQTM